MNDRVPFRIQVAAWAVRGGETGEREQRALDESRIFVGWPMLVDITGYAYDGIRVALRNAYPERPDRAIANWAGDLWRVTSQIAIGDYVVMPLRSKPGYVAIGTVTGEYEYKETEAAEFRHIRAVQWLRKDVPLVSFPLDLQRSMLSQRAVFALARGQAAQRVADLAEQYKSSQSTEIDDSTIQVVLPGLTPAPGIKETSDSYWRQNTAETEAEATARRLRGFVNEDLQKDGFVLDGVNADKWFAGLDLPFTASAGAQQQTAALFIEALAPGAEWSGLVREPANTVPAGLLGMLVMQTKIYLRLTGITKLRISVIAALVANEITHSPEVSLAATMVAALLDNMRLLTEDELQVFHAMQRISDGQVYARWLRTEAIIHALPKSRKRHYWQNLMASMKSKGVLEEADGKWRAVR